MGMENNLDLNIDAACEEISDDVLDSVAGGSTDWSTVDLSQIDGCLDPKDFYPR